MSDDPEINPKLIAAKQQWARDGRLLTGTTADPRAVRLPPGQRLVRDWPVLDLGQQPDVTPQNFRLDIDGAVRRPAEPDARRIHGAAADRQRLGHALRHAMVALRQPVAAACRRARCSTWCEPHAEARACHFPSPMTATPPMCGSTSSTSPTCSWCIAGTASRSTRQHGGPVRVLIPRLYLWKSAKWMQRIEFSATDQPGFWEAHGYHNNADPWLEERYSAP